MDFTETIIPLALMASESIAQLRPKASWAIDSEPIQARGIIVNYLMMVACSSQNPQHTLYFSRYGNIFTSNCLFVFFIHYFVWSIKQNLVNGAGYPFVGFSVGSLWQLPR